MLHLKKDKVITVDVEQEESVIVGQHSYVRLECGSGGFEPPVPSALEMSVWSLPYHIQVMMHVTLILLQCICAVKMAAAVATYPQTSAGIPEIHPSPSSSCTLQGVYTGRVYYVLTTEQLFLSNIRLDPVLYIC